LFLRTNPARRLFRISTFKPAFVLPLSGGFTASDTILLKYVE
jgi:hypothetical protein